MTDCNMCGKPRKGTILGRVKTDFCTCFENEVYEQKVDEPEKPAGEEELYAFNEGHRNELLRFLGKQSKEVRIHWLNWWKHTINTRLKIEGIEMCPNCGKDKLIKSAIQRDTMDCGSCTKSFYGWSKRDKGEKKDE